MKIIDCKQGTKEWHQARLGIPTSSGFDNILTTKGERSKQAEKYIYSLAGERVACIVEESYQSEAMLRGSLMEDEARQAYELIAGVDVVQVGFCLAEGYGASPDGMIGEDGLLEIKCPNVSNHVMYLLKKELPSAYFQQVQGQLLVTGRKWVDFMSYSPRLPSFIIRVFPNKEFQNALRTELKKVCKEIEEITRKIKE